MSTIEHEHGDSNPSSDRPARSRVTTLASWRLCCLRSRINPLAPMCRSHVLRPPASSGISQQGRFHFVSSGWVRAWPPCISRDSERERSTPWNATTTSTRRPGDGWHARKAGGAPTFLRVRYCLVRLPCRCPDACPAVPSTFVPCERNLAQWPRADRPASGDERTSTATWTRPGED